MVKDKICPLNSSAIEFHRLHVAEKWGLLLKRLPNVAIWLKSIWGDKSWRTFW